MKFILLLTTISLIISFILNKEKTLIGIKKGIKMFLEILPSVLNILVLVSISLYFLPEDKLSYLLGGNSNLNGYFFASLLGSIAMMPGYIAYPLSAVLIQKGVPYRIIAVFITTLMMVGILTLPIEKKYFGLKVSIIRNVLSFIAAIIIGLIIGTFI